MNCNILRSDVKDLTFQRRNLVTYGALIQFHIFSIYTNYTTESKLSKVVSESDGYRIGWPH